ncbi:uncharacterized protein BP01DRAFT_383234 [Aspergillus saccharolyticus JOP 1030-1]|uniref:carbonic anhydrase n=1 Tax=Aspergillus saccharolyticus JOP 1030-1 TaxID=1450539 RepID=A0A318ZJC7_9EURO|nr:hypothetical protein BP01DRAFT_383234 [Aspergillus saccharolyticus JOP 1030-1]PYH44663.1 hypothetical protein BP01DRAFT_383234 [Aspergillus saccharolyticus JOP 1030-1]
MNHPYQLTQFHFHTPSEHRVDQEYFPFNSSSMTSNLAVVAFLFQLAESDITFPLFDSVFAHLDEVTAPETSTETGSLDFTQLTGHLDSHRACQYTGSFATSPCTEVSFGLSAPSRCR